MGSGIKMDHNQSSPENSTYYPDYYYLMNDSLIYATEDLQIAGTVSAVLYSLIICISLTANGFLLWVLWTRKGPVSPANLLLLHLTVSDLAFTVTLVPWAIYHVWGWLFGDLACKVLSGTIFLGLYSYMMFLTCMTVHRYVAVVHAVRRAALSACRERLYTHLTCTFVWVFSIGCSLPEAFLSVTEITPDGMTCGPTQQSLDVELAYHYMQLSIFFLLPFLIIAFCYARIAMTIQRSQIGNRQHAVWLIFCIVIGFFICWTPYNVTIFIHSLQLLGQQATFAWKEGLAYAYYITHILAYCHCCLNPLIQIFGGVKFRRYLSLSRGFRCLSERERNHTFTSQGTSFQTSATAQTCI
ncbi:chemokine XC receptor 1 [Electrophorus electricus]|uniref:chemokine XC receptor 1 n=1 Tax=Electrophorus electricus TaxID=8005 RepID=UPI0015CFA800|nr:chemokine XC receptor 1 [Electrophorus electricus]